MYPITKSYNLKLFRMLKHWYVFSTKRDTKHALDIHSTEIAVSYIFSHIYSTSIFKIHNTFAVLQLFTRHDI